MSRGIALLTLLALAAGTAGAYLPPELFSEGPRPGDWAENIRPQFSHARQETVWFGNVDENGYAVLGEVWDFDDGTFQGWTSIDLTDNPDVYFYWVQLEDFATDIFPPGSEDYAPMINETEGMIWCGIHTEDANELDYINGLGYGNLFCQRALSPILDFTPPIRINLEYDYFSWTEVDYDYVYVNLVPYGGASGDSLMADNILQLAKIDGYEDENGDYTAPGFGDFRTRPLDLPPTATAFQVEFLFDADGGWSDEDGNGDCPYGPCAFDNVTVWTEDDPPIVDEFYDFDEGPEGWTFEKCPAVGRFMQLVDAAEVDDWMINGSDLICGCNIAGQAMAFNSIICDDGYPGVLAGVNEMIMSPVVDRTGYPEPVWNETVYELVQYSNLPQKNGLMYRPGYRFYPFSSAVNPVDHWSPRQGRDGFYYASSPFCGTLVRTLTGMQDQPLPGSWDSLRFVYEIASSCDRFGIPPSVCTTPGCGVGSPVLDEIRVGITGSGVDAPSVSPEIGCLFMDGFGQNYPTYLEPSDRGNSNITYDAGQQSDPEDNDWNRDTSAVAGPLVLSEEGEWLAQFCFRLATVGPRQHWVPEYHTWKARFEGDPELDWVCVLMDSVQADPDSLTAQSNRFVTYFHEDDPGFDPAYPDYCEAQEILPDGVFTPGTSVDYYWRSYWYRGGQPPEEYYIWPPPPADPLWREFAILPSMEEDPEQEYRVRWPSVLYIDAFNRGAEQYLLPMFEQEEIIFDKFDYTDASSNWHAPMKRKFGGNSYNPGGWSNSGCTTEQLLAYRLIFLNTGYFADGCMEEVDFDMFAEWMEWTECGFDNIRRGFIFDGDAICGIMADETTGIGFHLAYDLLGVQLLADAYREANNDSSHCAMPVPVTGASFPLDAAVRVWNNGCPGQNDYNVIGLFPAGGALGNLTWYNYLGHGDDDYVDFAQVIKDNQVGTNMRTVVNGFSFHHLSQVGCEGELGQADCRQDSLCIVQGAAAVIRPAFDWIEDENDPFARWLYPCTTTDVDADDVDHIAGPVNHLYASRPNPFNSRATIRFNLASQGHVDLDVYDVSGRLVKTLVNGDADAGENSVVWDGTDNSNHPVGGGIFWVQMRTPDGYTSGKRMLVLR